MTRSRAAASSSFAAVAALLGTLLLAPERTLANIVYNNQIQDTYDYVVCGGGLAGLVIARRLAEDGSKPTVLVLEAGASGDAVANQIDVPANAYYSSLLGSSYDYNYQTTPQQHLNGRTLPWPRGKVVGGSTAVNGMYMVRPSDIEVNAWSQMLGNMDGAAAWNWNSLFGAMKKSETFTPPSDAIQKKGAIEFDTNSHGTSGPLHYSYPGFLLDVVGLWTATLDWIGIPPSPDANGGFGAGAFIATSAINPSNYTRSYARSAYIDPLPPMPNLDILPNATVTRIIFASTNTSAGLNATAVEYATNARAARKKIGVRREVIVAGGAIGSPAILMHSGVGPQDVLQKAGVAMKLNLPGVGQHLQDHLSTQVVFKTTADTGASIRGQPGKLSSFINSAIAYANITDLLGDYAPTFHSDDVNGALDDSVKNLVPSSDPTVIAGYKKIYQVTSDQILLTRSGQVELLLSLTGTSEGGGDSIAIQAALQHPFSQGHLYIANNDPFQQPTIDPAYLSHPADLVMLREGLKLARKIGQTQPLDTTITGEVSPGDSVKTDADWDAWIPGVVGTEYHPSCSCAMLPLELGGVVDANLMVHGLANVRVADSSVYPIEFAAHLMAPTYGLAELAAEIILAKLNNVAPPAASASTMTSTMTFNPTPTNTGPPTGTNTPGAAARAFAPVSGVAAGLASAALVGVSAFYSLFH